MKRLTDERVLQIQEDEGAGRVDNPDYATGDELDSLFRDHLQAREVVKRLVERLGSRVYDCEAGPMDERPLTTMEMCRCRACIADRALLSEVGQ